MRAAAAAARYDSDGRIRVVAGVVGDCDLSALRAHVGAQLPAVAVPAVIARIAALPLTGHGKIDRKALAARIGEHTARVANAGDELVARIAGWFTVLTRAAVGPDDDLDAVGGDSLARLGLLVRLEHEGFHLEHADLPRPLTPARLADRLRALAPVPLPPCDAPAGPFPLTDYQRVIVLESLANRGTAMWSDQLAFTLDGELDHAKLEQAWRDEVAAEPALRTSIDVATLRQAALPSLVVTVEHVDHRDLDLERYRQRVRAEEWTRLSTAFPLDAPPLFRLCVLAGPGSRHDLIFTYHHAILDGESARSVVRSVLARYAGRPLARHGESFQAFASRPRAVDPRWRELLAEHRATAPPEVPIATGMGDLVWRLFHRVLALRTRIAAARVRRRTRRIRALLSAAQLEPATYAGGDLTSQPIAAAQAGAIRAWARRHDTTEAAVWAALFALQLARERATDDVVFGVLVWDETLAAPARSGCSPIACPCASGSTDPRRSPRWPARSARSCASASDSHRRRCSASRRRPASRRARSSTRCSSRGRSRTNPGGRCPKRSRSSRRPRHHDDRSAHRDDLVPPRAGDRVAGVSSHRSHPPPRPRARRRRHG